MSDSGFEKTWHVRPGGQASVYKPGLYVNFYCNMGEWWESKYYTSPEEARKNIDWERHGYAYQFTARITDEINKYEKP